MQIARLVDRCLEGDSLAWEEFAKRFGRLLEYAARQRLQRQGIETSEEELEEIVQQIFVHLWEGKKLAQVRDENRIQAWLAVVAGNVALDWWRHQHRLIQRSSRSLQEPVEIGDGTEEVTLEATIVAEGVTSPREEIERNERDEFLQEALERLSTRERLVLKAWSYLGQTHEEIGQMLGIPPNTVSSIIHRAKAKLRKLLALKVRDL